MLGDGEALAVAGDNEAPLVKDSCDFEREAEAAGKSSTAGEDVCDMLADGKGDNKTVFSGMPLRVVFGVRLSVRL